MFPTPYNSLNCTGMPHRPYRKRYTAQSQGLSALSSDYINCPVRTVVHTAIDFADKLTLNSEAGVACA